MPNRSTKMGVLALSLCRKGNLDARYAEHTYSLGDWLLYRYSKLRAPPSSPRYWFRFSRQLSIGLDFNFSLLSWIVSVTNSGNPENKQAFWNWFTAYKSTASVSCRNKVYKHIPAVFSSTPSCEWQTLWPNPHRTTLGLRVDVPCVQKRRSFSCC